MKHLLKRPYIYWIIGIFLAYMALNIVISEFYVTIKYIPYYLNTLNWTELILSAVFSLTIGMLVSMNMVTAYIRYKERKNIKKEGAFACVGTVAGLATGVCSACVAGIVPLLLSIFGITFSFASLPFKGMEIQLLTIAILGISLFWLRRK